MASLSSRVTNGLFVIIVTLALTRVLVTNNLPIRMVL